jgi:O-antigen/teichoic acid export membrane protein
VTAAAPAQSVGRNIAAASMFMIGLRMSFRVLGVISSLVLIRLLLPTDFGLVGLAMAFASGLETLTETSFAMALIRLPDVTRRHLDTAFTFQVLRGVLIGGGLAAGAGLAASWMGEPRVEPIMWVIGATAFVQGFENIGMVEYRRHLQFGKIFESRLYAKLFGLAVMLPMAALTRSYWSLVAGIVALRLFQTLYTYYQHPYRPRLSLAAWQELFHFSKWLFLSNLLGVIESTVPTMLFGRIAGASGVGLYQVACQVATLPTTEIASPIREPIYSGYAKLQQDIARLRQQFVDGLGVLLLVIAPMSIGIALTARLLTPLVLGPQWSAAPALIVPCALAGLLDAVAQYPHNLFMVLNRQRSFVVTLTVMLIIRFPVFIAAGSVWGMAAGVYMLAASTALTAAIWMRSAMLLIDLRLGALLAPLWRTAGSTAAMAAVLLLCFDLAADVSDTSALAARLVVVAASGAAVQIGVQSLLWLASGMPEGPETKLAGLTRAAIYKLLAFRPRGRARAG